VCEPFDKSAVRAALPDLRDLTNQPDPQVFVPRLIEIGRRIGIAFTLEPAPKGCPASGATRWLAPDKALLMVSLRHKSNDHLWFSLFHEIGHLLLHSKKMLFLELEALDDEHEQEANRFAGDQLIPPTQAKRLLSLGRTKAAVQAFATALGIAPGIVVGRMQNDGLLPWSHLNGLKVFYHWQHNS
jgi:HTH-type transcriptional regulator/antitoxin HigA